MINLSFDIPNAFRNSFCILLACILLSSCGSTPTKEALAKSAHFSIDEIPDALRDAKLITDQSAKTAKLLKISESLINLNEINWARNTLQSIPPESIDSSNTFNYLLISAHLALIEGQLFHAKNLLGDEQITALYTQSSQNEKVQYHELKADLLYRFGELSESIKERLKLTNLYQDNADLVLNHEQLWQTLMDMPFSQLEINRQQTHSQLELGWYQLASLSKNNQTNLNRQLAAVNEWILNWPEHPASLSLPADLQLLKQLAAEQPKNIALVLPLTGKFEGPAKAIRDGFMAAYYENTVDSTFTPTITIVDSTNEEIETIYTNLAASGTEIIIGPLQKQQISKLATLKELKVPVLALNHIDDAVPKKGLYQFGLAIEDEISQVATQAWKDGHRKAMIIAPNNTWGDRGVQSFMDRWLEFGGQMSDDYRFKSQKTYSTLIKDAVQVTDSQARARALRKTLREKIQFEPRRRQDIDFILLIANAKQARQIKPILAFHYAGDIPVYSVSHIYDGSENTRLNKDMNNIRFTTLPWFFDESPEKSEILKSLKQQSKAYQSLYALGVDAFQLYPRLRQLETIKQSHYYGNTGKLSINDKKVIVRDQIWALYKNGQAKRMPPVAEQQNEQGF